MVAFVSAWVPNRSKRGRASGCSLRKLLLTSVAVLATGASALAEDVNITASTATGVDLDGYAGTTARVFPGVTVANVGDAISATTQAWTLTNQGTVGGANSILFTQGGTVTNSAGSQINASQSGISLATFGAGGAGTVYNYGTITSTVQGVSVNNGGIVTNYLGGSISTTGGNNAVSVGQGSSRTVINSGEIHADKTTGFSTGILVQGGASTVTNNSTGIVTGGYNGVYASGSAALTFTNAGSITAVRGPAVEAGGGGTFNNTGTIQSGNDGMLVSGAATVTNSGAVGSTGAGRAIAFSGAATHTLNLNTGSTLTGNVQGGTGTDNLVLLGSGNEGIAKFLSFETLAMQGSAWTLTGTGAFTSSTDVTGGVLNVNGQLTSPTVTVASGGTLGGNGTIIGAVTNNGNIAPGNSIGTLNITGTYTQATGSIYNVEVNTTPASDLINVTGSANIQNGATVNVLATPGVYTVGNRYTILTASTGVTGTYDTLTDNAPFVDFVLNYDANNVYLDVLATYVSFQSVAQTPNQRAAASGAEQLGVGNPIFDAILTLSTPDALTAFDRLSGEIHASLRGSLIEETRFLRDAITARLSLFGGSTSSPFGPAFAAFNISDDTPATSALAYAGASPAKNQNPALQAMAKSISAPDTLTAWAVPFGNWGRTQSDGNAATLTRNNGGFIGGIDKTTSVGVDDWWRYGFAGSIQRASLHADDRASSASIDSYLLAAYAGRQLGPLNLRGGASLGWHAIGTSRSIAFPGFSDSAASSYGAYTAQIFGEAGYRIQAGTVAYEPFAGLAYVDAQTRGFTETGGAAALTGNSGTTSIGFSTLGLRAWTALPWNPAMVVKAGLGWRHAFGSVTPTAELAFASPGTSFVVAGVPISRNAATVDFGLDGAIAADTTIGVAYTGQIGQQAWQHGFNAHLVRRF